MIFNILCLSICYQHAGLFATALLMMTVFCLQHSKRKYVLMFLNDVAFSLAIALRSPQPIPAGHKNEFK